MFPYKRLSALKAQSNKQMESTASTAVPTKWSVCGFHYTNNGDHTDKRGGGSDFDDRLVASLFEEHSVSFHDAAERVTQLFRNLPQRDEVIRTVLGDYMEQLIRWAVGPTYVPLFVAECLANITV
jgi:hypothetical protein